MFSRPTLQALYDQAINDIKSRKSGSPIIVPGSPLDIIAKVLSAAHNGQYGYIDYVSLESIPVTATDEYLEAWAALVGIYREPAASSTGSVTFAGTPGVLLPVNTILRRTDSVQYETTSDGYISSGGTITVTATCLTPGATGNTPTGSTLTIGSAVPGVISAGIAATDFVGGADEETDDSLRNRMLLRFRSPPSGGDADDYISWALAVPGTTRAWVNPVGFGAGTVVVYSMRDIVNASNNGFPIGSDGVAGTETRAVAATGDQLTVANYIYPLRPVTALVYSVSPIPYPVNFVVTGLGAISAIVQGQIIAALQGMFLSSADPLGGDIYPSQWEVAIAGAIGAPSNFSVTPAIPISAPLGYLPIFGGVTFN